MRTHVKELETILKKEEKKLHSMADVTKKSADETATGALTSPSASGDRFHSANAALITKENHKRVQELLAEVIDSLKIKDVKKIQSVCYIEIKYEDGRVANFYLVSQPVYLNKVSFISVDSPIGKALIGKTAGNKIEFNNQKFDILSIG